MGKDMAVLDKQKLMELYRKRAGHYNVTANLYYLIGFREWAYRNMAVDALGLKAGGTVVEIGCGTGINFPLLHRAVGPKGKIIGVDLTDAMLDKARQRVKKSGRSNVELVQSDAAAFSFPEQVDGVLSTFALTLVPEYDAVIRNGCNALKPGRRWVILDFKMPSGPLSLLAPVGIFLARPFGVQKELTARHPWESVSKYMADVSMTELYGGFAYIAAGERKTGGC
jgi:demethylmenaquinone methyltransferase/2-methoxy-6-polyprenyl-1,4-benzoquinol methylase